MNTQHTEQLPLDRLAKIYRKIRAAQQELTQKYDAELAVLEEQRSIVSNEIKEQMKAAGSTSTKTEFGTIIISTKTRYWTQDWDSFKQFVMQHDALDLFEKRIAQSNMSKFLADNPGTLPPGLNADAELVVSVRKPT